MVGGSLFCTLNATLDVWSSQPALCSTPATPIRSRPSAAHPRCPSAAGPLGQPALLDIGRRRRRCRRGRRCAMRSSHGRVSTGGCFSPAPPLSRRVFTHKRIYTAPSCRKDPIHSPSCHFSTVSGRKVLDYRLRQRPPPRKPARPKATLDAICGA